MPRLKLTVAYVGTRYCGWQIQDKPDGPPTVQGELERVVRRVSEIPIRIHGAGRTDSGVHADGQVAHMDVPESKMHLDWRRIFNTTLPGDINVLQVERVPERFHARFDAVAKTYSYQLWRNRQCMPPRLRPFVWDCGPLDLELLDAALPMLIGTYDCAVFQNTGTDISHTERTIRSLARLPEERKKDTCAVLPCAPYLTILRVTADGFLKQMVRNMVGLLVAVARGKLPVDDVPELLACRDRRRAPATAPAQGLTLTRVWYEEEAISSES